VRDVGQAAEPLRVLLITQGQWGERIATNISTNAPSNWVVHTWAAPRVIPPVVDDPEDFLPDSFPLSDLVVALGDVPGLAQLIPDIAKMAEAAAVIAPIDRNASLPGGLARQLEGWLEQQGVAVIFPKPFCSLTETRINRTPLVEEYQNDIIAQFAAVFGKPELAIEVEDGRIASVEVQRDAACGCARHVAEQLPGTKVDDAVEEAGMLHHHFPCLADMQTDPVYRDTLMHVSGNILRDTVKDEIRSHLSVIYLRPDGLSEDHD
jgi:hypothetical protein